MADRPRDSGWWIASDGKWYPPNLQPDPSSGPSQDTASIRDSGSPTEIPKTLTTLLAVMLIGTSVVFVAAAFFSFRYAAALGSTSISAEEYDSTELAYLGWSSMSLLGLMITGLIVIMWTYQSSKRLDARGTVGRRWRGGWTIGSWFVPFASFVIPKLVFNELEKAARTPYVNGPVGTTWKQQSRSGLGDLWWLLWVSGLVMLQATQIMLSDPLADDHALAVLASLSAIAHALLAGAGVAMMLVVRRIEIASRNIVELPEDVL